MPEERLTISSSARMHPDEVARHTFGTTRRGFDPVEVRAFLEHVARELVAAGDREQELRRAVAEAEHRAVNPVLDEATLTAALGLETARVLRSAHEAAADLVARAENDASRLRAQAQEESEQLLRHSEQVAHDRTAEADAAAAELRRRAHEEATARVDGAKLEAEALVTQARAECRTMVQEAQELRTRVLTDLARRRRVLHSQIEQLRAGRERLAETIGDVRHAVDQISDELFRAEDQARLAAEAAGRNAAQEGLPDVTTIDSTGADAHAEAVSDADETDTRQSVEELFARLRAEAGAPSVPEDPGVPDDQPSVVVITDPEVDAPTDRVRVVPAPGGASARRPAGKGPGQTAAPRGRPPSGPVATPDPGPSSSAHPGAARPGAQAQGAEPRAEGSGEGSDGTDEGERVLDPVVSRRDEILTPLVANLARRLKRALQDDQNDILDRLRAKGGWAPGVLPPADDHARRYVEAVADQLLEAAQAGATFAGGKADDAPGVEDVAAELASDVVVPLRRRLEGDGPSVEEGDESALVELVGAAFREWKGARTERLAGDRAVFAFARAALGAVPEGTVMRWVVDDDVAECPDCDDNALAGPVPSGEAFPTGHPHPPAHAGCRCLLAPANA
jgi:DivIVA domain-containing protein